MIVKTAIDEYISDRIIMKTDDFLYVLPNELLRPYISHYTITYPNICTISTDYAVIPNGGSTLVFAYEEKDIRTRCFGAATKTNRVGEEANRSILLLIISFRPCGAARFLRVDQSELTDLLLPLETVDYKLYKAIRNVFEQSLDIYELLSMLDHIFLSYDDVKTNNKLALELCSIICSNSLSTVGELSDITFYSKRHLGRVFSQYSGMNIKTYIRLVRINMAIKQMKETTSTIAAFCSKGTVMQTALNTGFYDQSHFIREFKSICEITPMEYLQNMSDFYNEI